MKWFWEVLAELSDREHELFLMFVWAKSRLPATAAEFPLPFKIEVPLLLLLLLLLQLQLQLLRLRCRVHVTIWVHPLSNAQV